MNFYATANNFKQKKGKSQKISTVIYKLDPTNKENRARRKHGNIDFGNHWMLSILPKKLMEAKTAFLGVEW